MKLHNKVYDYIYERSLLALYKIYLSFQNLVLLIWILNGEQCNVQCTAVHTEYTQSGNGHFLAYIPSRLKIQPRLVRVGDARRTPTLFHYIYHHIQKLWYIRSSWERMQIHLPYVYSTPICTLWQCTCSACWCHVYNDARLILQPSFYVESEWYHLSLGYTLLEGPDNVSPAFHQNFTSRKNLLEGIY
jgi:hypothetical protein